MNKVILSLATVCVVTAATLAMGADPLPAAGSAVEVREGVTWSHATYVRKEGRKLLIRYDDGTEDWILPDRMRAVKGDAGGTGGRGAGTPAATGSPKADEPAAASPGTPVDLDGTPIEILLDKATPPKSVVPSLARMKATTRPAMTAVPFLKLKTVPETPIEEPARFVVCPDTPGVVVGLPGDHRGNQQQVLILDLANPTQVEVRPIDTQGHQIIGAASGGKLLLSKPARDAVTLHLWEYDGSSYKPKANYTLASSKGGKRINWASLQSPTRVAVGCDHDELYLIDLKLQRGLTFFTGRTSGTFIFDGSVFDVEDHGSVGLVKGSDFGVIAQFKGLNAFGGMSIDPAGSYLAYTGGADAISVMKISSGALVKQINGAARGNGRLQLLSPDAVLVGNHLVYDVKSGIPLCEYIAPDLHDAMVLPSGQVLLSFRSGAGVELCLATLPDPRVTSLLKSAKPTDFALAPGSRIALSGDLSGYGSDKEQVVPNLQKALAASGHKLVAGPAPYRLEISIAAGKTGEFTYQETPRFGQPMMGPPPIRRVPSPSTDVRLTLYHDKEAIWSHSYHHQAAVMVFAQGGKSIDQAIADEGRPKVAVLEHLPIPSYLPKGSVPSKPAAFRQATISPDGFGPLEEPAPAVPEESPEPKGPAKNET